MARVASDSNDLTKAIGALQGFCGPDLTRTLAQIEASLQHSTMDSCAAALEACGARSEVLDAAGLMKRLAGQINVVIHALGILLCLPRILKTGEVIEYVSLGAGNTGRSFDLETNQRIAEFKFIRWQGGPESIRQNALFKDFYLMAEHETDKAKFLYVLDTTHPIRFFTGGRAISSVLSRHVALWDGYRAKFGEQHRTVREYYALRKDSVVIEDVSPFVPELLAAPMDSDDL